MSDLTKDTQTRAACRIALALLLVIPLMAHAQPSAPPREAGDATAADKKPAPEEKSSQTRHTMTLNGQTIAYTATAGTLLLKKEDGTPLATVFTIAYIKDGVKDPATRPVTFAFNGGPGSASLWVHLGAFGPKRVARDPEGMSTKPPGRLVDNDLSILDVTDLVFIDPVDTGYSRTVPEQDPKQFHGVRQDVESVGEVIRLWLSRNERWASPKLLAGESYGTTRGAALARELLAEYKRQIAEARGEGRRILEDARKQADAQRERTKKEAREEGEKIIQRAREEIGREREGALRDVRREVADMVINASEQVLARSVDRDEHERLISQALDDLENEVAAGNGGVTGGRTA